MNTKNAPSFDITMFGMIFFITLIGLTIRLAAPLQAAFPLNDGGLFYNMIASLREHQYVLPTYAAYNNAEIPFAYPPLAFYITGFLADLLRVPLLDLARILPSIISALTIPAFYSLAKEITSSKVQILLAVFAFAMLPRDFAWLIMGGGITRSFGLFFSLLTMAAAYRFYSGHRTRHFLACILLGALTVLTHPEATVHTALTALIFYLWLDRSKSGFLLSLGMAAGILALTSPWWSFIISHHGINTFLAAMNASRQDSLNPLAGLLIFFRFMFTDEPFLPVLAVLGLIGIFASFARRQFLLPAWMFLLHLIEPRGGPLFMMIPLALLVGYALENVVLPALRSKGDNPTPTNAQQALESILRAKASRIFLILLFFYSLFSAYSVGLGIKDEISIQPPDLEAFAWVRQNTPADANFVLITGQLPFRDAWSEWFPVLAERKSQATIFGYEWVIGDNFEDRIAAYNDLQACRRKEVSCLDKWSSQFGKAFDYVLIRQQAESGPFPLRIFLEQNKSYEKVFEYGQTTIYHRVLKE